MPILWPQSKGLSRHLRYVPVIMLLVGSVLLVVRDTRINSLVRKPFSTSNDSGYPDSGLVADSSMAGGSGTAYRHSPDTQAGAKHLEPLHGHVRDSAGAGNDSPAPGVRASAAMQTGKQPSIVSAEVHKEAVGKKHSTGKTPAQPPVHKGEPRTATSDSTSSAVWPTVHGDSIVHTLDSTAVDTQAAKGCFVVLDVSSSMDSILNDRFLSSLGRLTKDDSCKAILFADSAVEVPPAMYKDSASLVNINDHVGEGTNIESAIFLLSRFITGIKNSRLKLYLVSDVNFAVESFNAEKALLRAIETVVVLLPDEHADDHETQYRVRRLRKVFGRKIEVTHVSELTGRE